MLKNKKISEKIKFIIHGIIKDSEGLLYGFLTHVGPKLRSREWQLLVMFWAYQYLPAPTLPFQLEG